MAYWHLNINNQDSFPAKGSPVPITLTWRDASDYYTQEEKVQISQSNDLIVQSKTIWVIPVIMTLIPVHSVYIMTWTPQLVFNKKAVTPSPTK